MYKEHAIHVIAGIFILISLTLSQLHSVYWLLLTGFVGLNLLQHGFSKWCLMEKILGKAGFKSYAGTKTNN